MRGEVLIQTRKTKLNSKGQSTIEFIISFSFVFAFTFVFFRIALLYANGHLVHYATYMASRAYMVYDSNATHPHGDDENAAKLAQKVFEKFKLGSLIKNFDNSLNVHHPRDFSDYKKNLYVGVWVDFKQKLPIPFAIKGRDLDLRSESFLGREPTRSECYWRIAYSMGGAVGGGNDKYKGLHSTLFDNGC